MASHSLQVSEARRRLSALVERVAQGGAPVTIGRYGRDRAVLVGAEHYARLTRSAPRQRRPLRSIEGTMTLTCTPEELVAESRRLGDLWLAAFDESSKRLTRRRPRRK
ncbi:MAG TPA: type II toxin-antitoxin system Phd/YefM family antitoxin [Candidatus Acidoferrales bacterium]|nr:type II toxin-antitoxin system Phd/YefM family antitoxin [Candidatus Acidoferrales bacterium]